MSEHPGWCVGEAGGCDGRSHRSAGLTVPGDELSGIEVAVALWRGNGGREFVELAMTPVRDNFVALALACNLAEDLRELRRAPTELVGADDETSSVVFNQDASDPEYITDPHAHDLTIDQAEALHCALGGLLAGARKSRA